MESRHVRCNMCDSILMIENPQTFFQHVKSNHMNSKAFYVVCKYPFCNDQYHLYQSFKRHWNKQHKTQTIYQIEEHQSCGIVNYSNVELPFEQSLHFAMEEQNRGHEASSVDMGELSSDEGNLQNSEQRIIPNIFNSTGLSDFEWEAGVLLRLKQHFFLPFDAILFVSSMMHEFVEIKLKRDRTQFQFGHDGDEVTRFRLEETWRKLFPATPPMAVILNPQNPAYEWVHVALGGSRMEAVFETGYIVPFLDDLQQFLSIKSVYEAVLLNFSLNNPEPAEIYSDVWDGRYVKSNSSFLRLNGSILGFQIYMDEAELANPLGSKKGKHKVSIFYWMLMNLPPLWRSQLRSIKLLGIVSSELLKKNGVKSFLKPFLSDMALLENGCELTVRNIRSRWFGLLLNFSGDMPASNFIGGFKEGVGFAHLPCRNCMIERKDLDLICHVLDCTLREKTVYLQHIEALENPSLSKTARDQLSSKYGINSRCSLSILKYFDPTKCYLHDIMHILYEGILNMECALLLKHLIEQKGLDLDDLNYKIKNIQSSREFTDPPSVKLKEIMELKKLSLSSSEMSCLTTVLPIILSDLVPISDDPYYFNFILLLEITASLQCYSYTEANLNLLQKNIEIHNKNHVILYRKPDGSCVITPKLHALLHLPSQIRQFGPPRYFWCFRYESKNALFKKIMKRNCNFHNVPFTLASTHQKLVGLDIRTDGEGDFFGISEDLKRLTVSDKISVSNCRWSDILCNELGFHLDMDIRLIHKFKITGRICSVGTFFLRELQMDLLPLFYRVVDGIVTNDCTYLIMEKASTQYFCLKKFSFVVNPEKQFTIVKSSELPFPAPLQAFSHFNKWLVVPNYYHIL